MESLMKQITPIDMRNDDFEKGKDQNWFQAPHFWTGGHSINLPKTMI